MQIDFHRKKETSTFFKKKVRKEMKSPSPGGRWKDVRLSSQVKGVKLSVVNLRGQHGKKAAMLKTLD